MDQTQATYAAEDLWRSRERQTQILFGDWHEIQPFYVTLAAAFRAAGDTVYPPTVKPRKGMLKAHYDPTTSTVHIPPYDKGGMWALNVGIAIHEFAHHVAGAGAGHGPRFRAAMVDCLKVSGWNHALLEECYAEAGLTLSDKDDGILSRVSKVYAQADAPGRTAEEKRMFLEKAQVMAAEHSIDLALLRKRQADADDKSGERDRPTTGKLFDLTSLTNTTHRNLTVDLANEIAAAHGAKVTVRGKSNYLTFYGFPEDIHLTELMVTRVTPMMFEEADVYVKSPERRASGVAAVSARITFCQNFAIEIGNRLRAAVAQTRTAVAETLALTDGSVSAEIALREKEIEVNDYVNYVFKQNGVRGSWKGSRTGSWSSGAANAGREAGQRANLFGRKEVTG